MGRVNRRQLQGLGFVRIYWPFLSSNSLKYVSFSSKISLAVFPSSLRISRSHPENRSSFEMFFKISKPSSANAISFSSFPSCSCNEIRISIICLMQRCKQVFPSMSLALGSAPSFKRAYTFWINMLTVAKWSAVTPLESDALILILWMREKIKIDNTPSYLWAAQWITVCCPTVFSRTSAPYLSNNNSIKWRLPDAEAKWIAYDPMCWSLCAPSSNRNMVSLLNCLVTKSRMRIDSSKQISCKIFIL